MIVEIKSSLYVYGVSYDFLDLDRDSHSFKRNVHTLGESKKLIRISFWIVLTLLPWTTYCVQGQFDASVFEMKTFESDSKSIIDLESAKLMSDLLACQLLVIGPKRSMFNEPQKDLEQFFCVEIVIIEKHLKTVKETKSNKSVVQPAESVERSENEESQVGKVDECEFNVLTVFRVTDLMFECDLTCTAASRKAERTCVNMTSILICWT